MFKFLIAHRPLTVGKPEKVTLAGAEREAQSFMTGESLATTNWCVVKVQAAEGATTGLLVLLHIGGRNKAEPSCGAATGAAQLKPLVESFAIQ